MIFIGAALALFIGLSLGIFGAGGSILTVPLLHYVLGLDAQTATGASLLIVGSTAMVGTILNARKKLVAFQQGILFAVPSFFGVFGARTLLLPSLPQSIFLAPNFSIQRDTFILIFFAVVMILAATAMIKTSRKKNGSQPAQQEPEQINKDRSQASNRPGIARALTALQGFFIGVLSGFVGAGGGFLIIPALNIMLGIEMRRAIATSLFIIAMNSAVGVAGDLVSGNQYPIGVVSLVAGSSLAGMFVGTKLADGWDSSKLKPAFGIFILVIGAFIIAKELL